MKRNSHSVLCFVSGPCEGEKRQNEKNTTQTKRSEKKELKRYKSIIEI